MALIVDAVHVTPDEVDAKSADGALLGRQCDVHLLLDGRVEVVNMEIGRAGGNGDLALRSVLGVSGLRWAVRTAATCLGDAPVGNALMLFMAIVPPSTGG